MKCGSEGIDTHEKIIRQACGIFYYPSDSGNTCKFFSKCQRWINKVIAEDEEPKELHRRHIMGSDEE